MGFNGFLFFSLIKKGQMVNLIARPLKIYIYIFSNLNLTQLL